MKARSFLTTVFFLIMTAGVAAKAWADTAGDAKPAEPQAAAPAVEGRPAAKAPTPAPAKAEDRGQMEIAGADKTKCEAASDGLSNSCWGKWRPYFSIGPALTAVSIGLNDGAIGIMDKAGALELHGSGFQYVRVTRYIDSTGKRETVRLALWEWGIGIQIRKPQNSPDVVLGVYGIPYGIRVNDFYFGGGLMYDTVGKLSWGWERLSVIFPLTYQFGV